MATGIVNIWTAPAERGRRGLSPHRGRLSRAGSCSASASAIPSTPRSTASPTTCWSSTSTRSTPRRCRPAGGSSPRSGPKVLKLAAQRSAGAHPYLTTPEHTGQARELVGTTVFLAPEHKVVLTTRRRGGPRDRPQDRRLLPEPEQLPEQLEAAGLHRRRRRQARQRPADRRGGGHGTPEDIARRLNEHLEAGADHVAIQVLGGWDKLLPTLTELAGPLGLKG